MTIYFLRFATFVFFALSICQFCNGRTINRDPRRTIECPSEVSTPSLKAFLTVSSLVKAQSPNTASVQKQLELNWQNGPILSGDWVGLFQHDPINDPTEPLVRIYALHYPGYYRTEVQVGHLEFPEDVELKGQCLRYWIGYIRQGRTILSECLQTYPSWMWNHRKQLGSIPLNSLMIPGTHNSGSYEKYSATSENVITRYVVTQDEDIWHQLLYGVRYFDIRVGYYPGHSDVFWLNHNYVRMHPLAKLVQDVKKYLQRSNELIVLDFHRFPVGFEDRPHRHEELVSYLATELSNWAAPSTLGWNVTMNDLWSMNRTLLIVYSNDGTSLNYPDLLWPRISQAWADAREVETLRNYMARAMQRRSQQTTGWVAMAELTPVSIDLLFRPTEGLRLWAHRINRNVTAWFRDLWWKDANMVAVDFLRGTDLVSGAIQSNLKRSLCIESLKKTTESKLRVALSTIQAKNNNQREKPIPPVYQGPRFIEGII